MSYYFGYDTITPENLQLYLSQVKSLMEAVDKRLQVERDQYIKANTLRKTGEWKEDVLLKGRKHIFAAGCIINVPSFFADQHPSVIKSLISIINPNVVLIIDHDGLKSSIKESPTCHVIKLPKSGGVLHLPELAKRKQRELKLDNYFFDERAICTRDQFPLKDIQIYKLVRSSSDIGLGQQKQDLKISLVEPLITDISKYVIGVTTLPVKVFNNLPDNQSKVDALVKSPIMTLAFVFEIKDIQQKSSSSEPSQKEAYIIRPSYIQSNYTDLVWIVGEIKNYHN